MATRFDPWARRRTRRLLLQALYQWQLSGNDFAAIRAHCEADDAWGRIDADYFDAVLKGVMRSASELDALLAPLLDRDVAALDQVERALLRMAAYELRERIEVPFKVIIDEATSLARTFGAESSFRYVNAVLDALAAELREVEVRAARAPG